MWEPTVEDMITLSESFHLCVAVSRKWVQEVRHKYTCAHLQRRHIASMCSSCHTVTNGSNC